MKNNQEAIRKYDRVAPTYSAATFANPASTARRQLDLVERWGIPARPRASVLELGCADGFVTETLAKTGLRVTGVDFSPGMIAAAQRRLDAAGLKADFMVADVEHLKLDDSYDVVAAMMRTFFHYVQDPGKVLQDLFEHTRLKLIVDLNPRTFALEHALDLFKTVGFKNVGWRGFFVPQATATPDYLLRLLRLGERIPLITRAALRRKFYVVIKGEKPGSAFK